MTVQSKTAVAPRQPSLGKTLLAGAIAGLGGGIVFGMILWVVGALIMMPLMLGMPILQIGQPQMMSLMGHMIYGVVTALLFVPLLKRFA